MNILYLCDEYPPGKHGGIGTVVQLLAREMVKNGHKVYVIGLYDWAYGEKDNYNDEGVTVYRLRHMLAGRWFRNRESLRVRLTFRLFDLIGITHWDTKISIKRYQSVLDRLIAEKNIDIVEMPDYSDYRRFCKTELYFPKLSIPYIVKLHGSMTYFNREMGDKEPVQVFNMEKDILENAAAICSVSKYTANKTASYFNITRPIEVIYNGINTNIDLRDKNIVPGLVVFTGTLTEKKGIYQLIKAWNIVAVKNKNARLWVFGKGPVNKLEGLLTKEARETVVFWGHADRKTLLKNLMNANLCIFPSYAETFGLAPVESMACETAVIYSNRTAGPEVIQDGLDGLLVDPDDIENIAAKIDYLLDNNEVCNKLASQGKKSCNEKFDIKVIARKNIDYYQQVLMSKSNA